MRREDAERDRQDQRQERGEADAAVEDPDRRADRQHVHRDEAGRGRTNEILGAADAGDEPAEQDHRDQREQRKRSPRNAAVRVACEPARQRAFLRKRRAELRGATEVHVHRSHRQRDREHRGRVAADAAEADRDDVCERDARTRSACDADRCHRETGVEHGHEAEGERHRAR